MRVRTFLIVFTLLVVVGVALLVCRMWLGVAVSDYVLLADGVLLLGVLLLFRWQIVEPLHLMETGMLLLREQDFSSRLRRVGQTDADNIVDVFNRMMDALKAERLHVREQNQLFDLIFRSSPMGILILDLDRRVDSVNPSGERLLGVSLEAVRGKRLDECSFDLCEDLCSLAMDEVRTVRLTDSNIYRCSRQSFLNGGFRHTFYLVELLTEEVSQAERKAYEKVIRMIAHEVNNTVAGGDIHARHAGDGDGGYARQRGVVRADAGLHRAVLQHGPLHHQLCRRGEDSRPHPRAFRPERSGACEHAVPGDDVRRTPDSPRHAPVARTCVGGLGRGPFPAGAGEHFQECRREHRAGGDCLHPDECRESRPRGCRHGSRHRQGDSFQTLFSFLFHEAQRAGHRPYARA